MATTTQVSNEVFWGPWIINIFMRPFHSLCGVLCCYGHWHPAAALITHGWESVTALCRLLWSAASTQKPGYNVLFMRNNQDLTCERVLKWYLWRGLSSAWKGFWKHLNSDKKKTHTYKSRWKCCFFLSSLNYIPSKEAGVDFVMEINVFVLFYGCGRQEDVIAHSRLNSVLSEIVAL